MVKDEREACAKLHAAKRLREKLATSPETALPATIDPEAMP
jgi:hypothetical protein